MKDFLRPEVLSVILRWREAAIGGGAVALGLWWAVGQGGVMRWVGVVVVLGGIGILREGLARSRRPRDGGGAGVVVVDERQVTYLSGPGGGAVSIEGLESVEVETQANGSAIWHLAGEGGERVSIPADAEGANAIFDALAVLPGLSHEQAVAAARSRRRGRVMLWQRPRPRLH